MGNYASIPEGPPTCGGKDDPDCVPAVQTFTEWLPCLFYVVWCLAFLLSVVWGIMRVMMARSKANRPSPARMSSSTAKGIESIELDVEVGLNSEATSEVKVQGYKNHLMGTITFGSLWAVSISILVAWLVLFIDYFHKCEWGGIDNLCFFGDYYIFGSYTVNSEVMMFIWVFGLLWYGFIIVMASKFRNLCRLPCSLREAEYVWVWRKTEAAVVSAPTAVLAAHRTCTKFLGTLFKSATEEGTEETVPTSVSQQGRTYFEFQCTRYLVGAGGSGGAGSSFAKAEESMHKPISQLLACDGLTSEEHGRVFDRLGRNKIPFELDGLASLLAKEVLTAFYLYQFCVYTVWIWFSYLVVGLVLVMVVVFSAMANVYLARKGQQTIRKMIEYTTDVQVRRSGEWVTVNAEELVPGDVIQVAGDNWVLPCDCMVLRGAVVLDESGLTGEAMPVRKAAPPSSPAPYSAVTHKKHTLFAGTKVLQAGQTAEEVTAVVTATGINTDKGILLSMILFPKKMIFKYDEELVIVFTILLVFGLIVFPVAIYFQSLSGSESSIITKIVYGIFTVSQILSPLLPVAMVVGQNMAAARLQKVGVYCVNPKRIAISGKIRVFCFDKTGTLTKDGLDFLGLRMKSDADVDGDGAETKDFADTVCSDSGAVGPVVMHGLATCHAVAQFGDRMVGNQVEVKMFEWTGFSLDGETRVTQGAVQLDIVKRFEFDHGRMAMSVIVRDPSGNCTSYTKGSFEKIGELSQPDSLPNKYHEVAKGHAMDGCYVLGLNCRDLGKLDDAAIFDIKRDDLEQTGAGTFLSLVMFRNELKDDTGKAIRTIKEADVRPVMITGDNAQCGYYIATACGMLGQQPLPVFLAEPAAGAGTGTGSTELVWTEMLSSDVQQQRAPHVKSTAEVLDAQANLELAMTGRAFNRLCASGEMNSLLLRTRIFARMSPDDKVRAVELHLEKGLITGMCGDGGNDCGALRAAHAGVALSEAEASVVSPFTARTKSVWSVVDLLREGRAALVNSFAGYKFLIIYGQLFCVLKLMCFYLGVIMCMMDYVFLDVLAVILLSYTMTFSMPTDALTHPGRPTASLLGPTTLASVLGLQVLNLVCLFSGVAMMQKLPIYIAWPAHLAQGAQWWTLGDNLESTFIFYAVSGMFMWSAVIFSLGGSFRKAVVLNWTLMLAFGGLVLWLWLMLILPPGKVAETFHIATINFNRPYTTTPVWLTYQETHMSACLSSKYAAVDVDAVGGSGSGAAELVSFCQENGMMLSSTETCSSASTDHVIGNVSYLMTTNSSYSSLNGMALGCGGFASERGMNSAEVWSLLGLIMGTMALSLAWELLVVQGPWGRSLRARYPIKGHVAIVT